MYEYEIEILNISNFIAGFVSLIYTCVNGRFNKLSDPNRIIGTVIQSFRLTLCTIIRLLDYLCGLWWFHCARLQHEQLGTLIN